MALPKFIWSIPHTDFIDPSRKTGWKTSIRVYSKTDLRAPIKGLVVMAKLHQAPLGLPRPTPSAALEWNGKRIRGINYELRHDNPDGTIVKGWHEHVWSPSEQDHRVIPANPAPKDRTLLGILQWGLEKWNIEVREQQGNLDGVDY